MQSSNNRALMYNLSGQVCPQTFFALEDQRNEPPLTPLRLWYLTSRRSLDGLSVSCINGANDEHQLVIRLF